jgi:DNA-binding protein H-NS
LGAHITKPTTDRQRPPPARHHRLTIGLIGQLKQRTSHERQIAALYRLQYFPVEHLLREVQRFQEADLMARPKSMEKMSLAELSKMQADIERIKVGKHNSERAAVREKIISIAREHGFDIHELFGRKGNGKGTRGKVAVKYRDNAGNTWTGRGRMPRWMVAATRGGKAKKEDFLIK